MVKDKGTCRFLRSVEDDWQVIETGAIVAVFLTDQISFTLSLPFHSSNRGLPLEIAPDAVAALR